jgi:hypothetical protein
VLEWASELIVKREELAVRNVICGLAIWVMACGSGAEEVDFRAYFEEQKAQYLVEFVAPAVGDQVSLETINGQIRVGTLFKLSKSAAVLLTERGEIEYRRNMLAQSSRNLLFAEDFAQAKAIEMTRTYKQQVLAEEEMKGHLAYVMVRGELKNKSEKEVKDLNEAGTLQQVTRTRDEFYELDISVVNNGAEEQEYTVNWYVIGHGTGEGAAVDKILNRGRRTVTVEAGRRIKFSVKTETVSSTEEKKDQWGKEGSGMQTVVSASGDSSDGYVVTLKAGAELLDRKSNNRKFLTDEWADRF